jgi:hypothetical protein
MGEFFGYSDSCPRLTPDDRRFLGELLLAARGANSFLESSATNLEDVLSFAVMSERLAADVESGRQHGDRLRRIIGRVYSERIRPSQLDVVNSAVTLNALTTLLRTPPREFSGTLSVVTTNYDLNAEVLFGLVGRPLGLPTPFARMNLPEYSQFTRARLYEPNGTTPIYKLHGSVNWFAHEAGEGVVVDDRIVNLVQESGPTHFAVPAMWDARYEPPQSPLLIPPSFLKPELPTILREAWKGAARALEAATHIAFIGYSFPSSDVEMSYFLATSLARNAQLRSIYLVDPRATELAARLTGVTSKMGSHFKDLLVPIPRPWAGAKLPIEPARS